MRAMILAGGLLLSWGASVTAQSPAAADDVHAALRGAAAARAARDGNAWSQHVTDDYVITHSGGVVHHRAEEIAEINASKPRPASEREDERLHWYGENLVIVTSKIKGQATRATDVFVRQGGRWKIAAAHSTPIQ